MLQANRAGAISAILVALTFWGVGLLLLRRRFRRLDVRLLFLFCQACAVALLIGLAYPRFRLPQPWMVSLAVASLIIAAPLLLHYQLTFPVAVGHAAPARSGTGAALRVGAGGRDADAWRRPVPWTSPAVLGALSWWVSLRSASPCSSTFAGRRPMAAVASVSRSRAPSWAWCLRWSAYILPKAVMGYSPAIPRWSVSLFLAIMPLSYLYATGRHDLFGIDHLLNRASVYAVLSMGIFALYLVVLLPAVSLSSG